MSFLHISLAALGSSLVAIPILLHLLMRQRPRHFMFPALRFVQARKSLNQRQLKLRHLMLLMLRCLAIAALALALARPFVPSAQTANVMLLSVLGISALAAMTLALVTYTTDRERPLAAGLAALGILLAAIFGFMGWKIWEGEASNLFGDSQAPVAAAMIFDVSPRMDYRHHNANRLEVAQEFGTWLLGQLPKDSQVAIIHSNSARAAFSADAVAAKAAIDNLTVHSDVKPLTKLLEPAVELLRKSTYPQKEIYVFSDLTQQSWIADREPLDSLLKSDPPMVVQILDVGVERPANLSLGDVKLSANYLAEGEALTIDIGLTSTDSSGPVQLELFVEKPDPSRPVIVDGKPLLPETTLRSRQTVEADGTEAATASFTLRGLQYGTHHGEIQLTTNDALNVDNHRFFSIEVLSPWPVLVTGPDDILPDLMDALSPTSFATQFVPWQKLEETDLKEFSAVAILDPAPLSPEVWRSISEFVSGGGGAAIFLGRNAQPIESFNRGEAQRVLPGKLQRQYRAGPQPITLRLATVQHPAIDTLRARADAIPWLSFPVYRHWVLDGIKRDAVALLQFSDNHPALIETVIGAGHILTMTTPVSDPLNLVNRPEWNRIPTGQDPWPYFVLVNDMFRYLVQSGETKLNYFVGEPAVLRTAALGTSPRLQVFHPRDAWQDIAATAETVTYRFTNEPGIYRVRNANQQSRHRGFSVNLPASATVLDRIPTEQLDEVLGPGLYRIARDRDDVNREIGEARRGRDFFPWLLLLFVLILAAESVLANRFYAQPKIATSNAPMSTSPASTDTKPALPNSPDSTISDEEANAEQEVSA